ncbi:MAG TPA: DUF6152 family protein, partial [Gammaproteobacteria bacterium]|nr:DUF6152 family protein [Gammaproteobacteria bacterium]
IKGIVTGVDFVNPHSWLYLDVTGADGRVSAYRCEMRSATVLRRSGWSPDLFKNGEPVSITGAPDRDDPNSCYLSTIIFADGSSADRYGQLAKAAPVQPAQRAPRLPSGEPNIFGDWAPEQLVMTDPRGRDGALVPLSEAERFQPGEQSDANLRQYRTRNVEYTELGKRAADEFDTYTTENPRMRCETTSILFDWTFDGPVNRIAQSDGVITLQYGQLGFTRTIDMKLSEHPASIQPSRAGHSIGRWENDVLIVDTVGFAPGVLSPPILNSEQLHVVERFSLDPSTMALTRSYSAEDPVYFTGQYAGSDTIHVADLPYAPDACDELTFVDYSRERQSRAAAEAAAAPAAETPVAPKPWWKFWD